MDAVHRQGQVAEQQRSGQGHHNQPDQHANNPGLDSAGYNQYSNSNNGVSNEDFNTFFNVPNDDPPSQNFNPSWDSNIIDPRLQHSSFGTQAWNQNSLNNSNSMGTPGGQGLASGDFPQAFTPNHPPFNFPPYNNPHFQNFQAGYGHGVSYGGNPMIASHNYNNVNSQQYGGIHGETIAPSALQSYPNLYSQSERQMFSQSPSVAQKMASGSHGGMNGVKPRRKVYDENIATNLANAVPAGTVQGNMTVKDPEAVKKATNSKQLTKFIFVGTETMDSEDPRGTIPKVPARKSLSELKDIVVEQQNGRPWDIAQRPLLKKLKMSSRVQKTQLSVSAPGAQAPSPSSSEDASSSDDDSEESDYDDGEEEKSPLPAIRPKDPAKAMEYDVIKIVWFKRSMRLGGSTIRGALGSYWEVVKPVRDAWKAEYSAITEADTKNEKVKAERHKTLASGHRLILESAFQATTQYGHPDLVEKLSENANLFLSFYQLLVDRFKEGDVTGNTVTSILNLMARCTSMNQALFEKTKLDKILPRLVKKGNESTQKVVQKITELVKANSTSETAGTIVKPPKSTEPKSTIIVKPATDITVGAKRVKEQETSLTSKPVPTTKSKTSLVSTNGKILTSAAKAGGNATKAPAVKNEIKAGSSAEAQLAVSKAKAAPTKTTSLFSGLQSASKKPGTSLAAQKANPPPETKNVKPPEPKKPSQPVPAPKASFSFAETMANLDKPREVGPVKKIEEQRPPETEEQKAKRLRRESRRHLRVSWKPEPILVEVRLFKHDPEEELGHDSNMIRDATDVKNEGQMLRLHKDLDLDDEDDVSEETELASWHLPTLIDFNGLPPEAMADNWFSRGGSRHVQSPEKFLQEQHERTTLIAIYTSKTDIPPSPREPTDPFTGQHQEEKPFGTGEDDKWEKIKSRENAFFAAQTPRSVQSFSTPSSGPTTDIHTLLKILGGGSQTQPQQPAYQPQVASMIQQQTQAPQQLPNSLESIFAQFKTPQAQAQAQVPAPAPTGLDPSIQKALETFNQMQQFQQAQPQQMYQPQAPVAQPQTQDLSTLLAQLGTPAGMSQQSTFNYQSSYGNDNDRKRPYDSGNQTSNQYSDSKRARGTSGKKPYTGPPKVPCKFYQEGKCKKGSDCTFLHIDP